MWSFGTTMTMAGDSDPSPASPASPVPATTSSPAAATPKQPPPGPNPPRQPLPPITSPRSLRQMSIFFAGAGFLGLSTLVTRRAVTRKMAATVPRFHNYNNNPPAANGALLALEALSLATLNAMAFGIMFTGGLAWAFDISNLGDLRRRAQKHIGVTNGHIDEEAEREVEAWVSKFMLLEGKPTGSPPKGGDSPS
ncbi:hypothetical protein GGR56DRAFT_435479 [Xylariaceae sp. FL0804]|nr:hypothetical protein GGR56DRAFT_435479 [Xylariaceae sp. FL0804]